MRAMGKNIRAAVGEKTEKVCGEIVPQTFSIHFISSANYWTATVRWKVSIHSPLALTI